MNSTCTHCGTVFRVDPAKVPAGGVRARCSICRKVFTVAAAEGGAATGAASVTDEAPSSPDAGDQVVSAAPAQPRERASAGGRAEELEASEPGPAAAPPAAVSASPDVGPRSAPPASPGPAPFGSSDPDAKARRLARALVSDMVTYHPDRRDAALASGTLKREFREEITKSWEEYVEQVGKERAMQTPHFRNALNEILARGQSVF